MCTFVSVSYCVDLVQSRHHLIEMYLVLAIAIVHLGNMFGVIAFVDLKKEYVHCSSPPKYSWNPAWRSHYKKQHFSSYYSSLHNFPFSYSFTGMYILEISMNMFTSPAWRKLSYNQQTIAHGHCNVIYCKNCLCYISDILSHVFKATICSCIFKLLVVEGCHWKVFCK